MKTLLPLARQQNKGTNILDVPAARRYAER